MNIAIPHTTGAQTKYTSSINAIRGGRPSSRAPQAVQNNWPVDAGAVPHLGQNFPLAISTSSQIGDQLASGEPLGAVRPLSSRAAP